MNKLAVNLIKKPCSLSHFFYHFFSPISSLFTKCQLPRWMDQQYIILKKKVPLFFLLPCYFFFISPLSCAMFTTSFFCILCLALLHAVYLVYSLSSCTMMFAFFDYWDGQYQKLLSLSHSKWSQKFCRDHSQQTLIFLLLLALSTCKSYLFWMR